MRFKNIIFDLDGTVTDPYIGITNSIIHSLSYYPHIQVPKREELKVFIGPPLYRSYMEHFGMDEATAYKAVDHYREYYSVKGKFENELYTGIKELLCELKENGMNTAIATSKPKVFASEIAEHFGFMQYLDYIAGSTLDHALIEKGDIIEHLFEISGYDRKESVMVGDTVYDIEGARKMHIPCIAVSYGYGKERELQDAAPYSICASVSELRAELLFDKTI